MFKLFTFSFFLSIHSWGSILHQYLGKVTLDISKGRFFTEVFLALRIHKTKLGIFSFIISYLKTKNNLKSKLEVI